MGKGEREVAEQVAANRSGVGQRAAFREHRERLTSLLLAAAGRSEQSSLCVLGAGNCNDLELSRLAQRYATIHLVDIDAAALSGARAACDFATQARLALHAPVDLSGLLDRIERWSEFRVTPEELLEHAGATARKIRGELERGFDVVLSACMLSQMQLSVLKVLTDAHRLFEAVRFTLNLTHLRTLAELLEPNGTAVFATDVTSETIFPLDSVVPGKSASALVRELAAAGHVFHFAHPDLLSAQLKADPVLGSQVEMSDLLDAWVWQNGSAGKLLVYAVELRRRPAREEGR